jgi:hypothetical protein
MRLLFTITAFILFSESIGVFDLFHLSQKEELIMIEPRENEEEKSEESELKKFDKNYLNNSESFWDDNASHNIFYFKHTRLYISGFIAELIQPPNLP